MATILNPLPQEYQISDLTRIPQDPMAFAAEQDQGRIVQRQMQMNDWEMMIRDEAGFDEVARRRGIDRSYQDAKGLIPGDELRKKLTRDLFVSDLTGADDASLQSGVAQAQAAMMFGIDDPSDEALDGLIHTQVAKQVRYRDVSQRVYDIAQKAAIQGTSWLDARNEATKLAGADWFDFEKQFNQGFSDIYATLSTEDVKDVDSLWNFVGRIEGSDVEKTTASNQDQTMINYERKSPEERDKIMQGIAMRAQAEGQDVDGAFNRMGQAFRMGQIGIVSGLVSTDMRVESDILTEVSEKGRVLKGVSKVTPENIEKIQQQLGRLSDADLQSDERTRPLSDDEKKAISDRALMLRGSARFMQDLKSAPVKAKQYIRENTQGGWFFGGSLENTLVGLAESVPSMLTTAVPIAGPAVMQRSYAEQERARLEHDFPGMSEEAIAAQSNAVGAWQAGADIIQNKLLVAKVPRLNATLMQLGKPGAVLLASGRAVTTAAGETAQEVFQDSGSPVIQQISSALNQDIKGPDWDGWMGKEAEAMGDIFRVSMLMGIIGGAGSTISDYMNSSQLSEVLKDKRGLALAGIPQASALEISEIAQTNPAAAAQLLQAAMIETPISQRREISQSAATQQLLEDSETTLRNAGIPEMVRNDDGSVIVKYNDGVTNDRQFPNPEEALADMDAMEQNQEVQIARANRDMIDVLSKKYSETGDLELKTEESPKVSLEQWAGGNAERVEVARQRVRIYLRQAEQDMGMSSENIDLGRYFILGSSRNEFASGVTRIVSSLSEGANPLTVLEEGIEGVGKYLIESRGIPQERMVGWIRETESFTRQRILAENFADLSPDLQFQELIEGWSRIGVAHATGRIADSQLPSSVKSFFRAIKRVIAEILNLAAGVKQFSDSGKMDPQMRYWLDFAAGFDTEGELANQRAVADSEIISEMEGLTGETFSVVADADPISSALDAIRKNPEEFVKFANAAKVAVADVSRRASQRALNSNLRQRDFDQFRDMAKLEAIARALPGELRGILTSDFRKVAEMRTTEGRERYIASLLPKVEQAIESNLQKTLRKEIKKTLKKGAVKVSDARTRGGKIGGVAHAIFEEAQRAIKITDTPELSALQQADQMADKLRDQMEGNVTDKQLEELDGRVAAIELFADYENADSGRLTEALDLLKGVYAQGRAERLAVLKARKEQRQQRVQTLLKGLDREGPISDAQRTASKRKFGKFWSKLDEGIIQAGISGSQKFRRISEATDDAATKSVVEDLEFAALEAELAEQDANEADNVALGQAMRAIFGAKTEYGVSAKLRELTTPSVAPVEKAEGKSSDKTIKVPIKYAEAIASGQTTGFQTKSGASVELTPAQIEQVRDQLDEMDPEDQEGVRSIEVTEAGDPGQRQTIGEISQLEGLQLWLTMRQPDQFAKLEKMGYDQETMDQLDSWLKPETKALGLWMVNRIGEEAFTIDQLHRSEKGVGLRLVENYFPVRNDVSGADNTGLSIDGPAQHTGKSVSSLKERVKNNAPPAYVNAVAVFLANRAQVNFWKTHVSFLREWVGVLKDERLAAGIKNRMGETYYRSLMTTMKRIEGGGALNAAGLMDWERVVRKMTSNFALATLGGRLSTLLINTTAGLNSLLEIPAGQIAKGLGDVIARPGALNDALQSPAIQRRLKTGGTYEAQIARAQGLSTHPVIAQLGAAAQIPVSWITKVDTGSQIIGAAIAWEYTKNQSIASGMDEQAARAEADKKVERIFLRAAQPTTRLAKSELELRAAENPLAALFTLFTSEPRKNLAIGYLAARELLTGKGNYGKAMAAQQLFTVLLVQTTAAYLIRSLYASVANAKDDEDEDLSKRFSKRMDPKALTYSLATEHLKAVPIIGEIYNKAMAGMFDQPSFDSSPNPLNRVTQKGWKFAEKMFTDDKPATREETIDGGIDAVQSIGSILPGGQVFAQVANMAEAVEGILSANVQETLSPEDRVRRIKARFSDFSKEYTEQHGKVSDEDGKIDKEKQKARNAVLADQLKIELSPLTPELRDKALEELNVSDAVIKEAGFKVPKK